MNPFYIAAARVKGVKPLRRLTGFSGTRRLIPPLRREAATYACDGWGPGTSSMARPGASCSGTTTPGRHTRIVDGVSDVIDHEAGLTPTNRRMQLRAPALSKRLTRFGPLAELGTPVLH
jgi:hypothetical protein